MRIRPRPERRRRGAALLLSLLAVLAVGAISATISRIQSTMEGNQRFSVDRRAALYVAEAGMAEATLAVSQGKSGEIASEKFPAAFGRGVFWVESEDEADGSVELLCTAQVGTAQGCPLQAGEAQIGAAEVGAIKAGLSEVGALQAGLAQIDIS